MELFDNFDEKVYKKITDEEKQKNDNNEFNDLFKQSGEFKNHFYFENLTDNEFFNASGVENSFVDFYKKITKSGVGTIILGGVYVENNKNKLPGLARISLDEKIMSAYKQIVQMAHSVSAKIFLKVKSTYGRFNFGYQSLKLASNYGLDPENNQKILLRISDNICNEMINDLSQISLLSSIAGFDGIMIDASHENVIGELSSQEFNKRIFGYYSETTDFLKKALKHIQTKNTSIILKLSVASLMVKTKNNFNYCKLSDNFNYKKFLNDIIEYIKLGVDGFEFVFGTRENEFLSSFNAFENEYIFEDFFLKIRQYLNENDIKNKFGEDIIILYHDNFKNFSKANKMVAEKQVDLIDVTKNIYSDIDFLKKLFLKKSYLNCIKCSECDKKAHFNNKISCVVNPSLNDCNEIINDGNKKIVAVIGSGISGLVCALTLLKRGYLVHIYEQKNELNFNGKLTTIFGFDKELEEFYGSIEKQILNYSKTGRLSIFFNQKFETNNENINKYYAIIIATGFKTKFLSITGAILPHVKNIYEVLNNREVFEKKKHIVIYAKTSLSLKLALYLLKSHKNITIIIKDTKYFIEEKNANLLYFFWNLHQKQANILIFSRITKINEDNIDVLIPRNFNKNSFEIFKKSWSDEKKLSLNQQINLDCDLLIYEPDTLPNNHLYAEIVKNNFPKEIYLIGNALQNTSLDEIIKSGYFVGKNL